MSVKPVPLSFLTSLVFKVICFFSFLFFQNSFEGPNVHCTLGYDRVTCLQHLSIIHSAHSWVQLSLLRGSGTRECQVKRLPLLCLLWLQTDWWRAKSQVDYCKSVNVIEAFSLMWVRAIKHKKIAHLHSGTHHCVAMFASCVWWVVSKKNKKRIGS